MRAALTCLLLLPLMLTACDHVRLSGPPRNPDGTPGAVAQRPAPPAPYEALPRTYPNQTNTTPVGWVSPEERAAAQKREDDRKAAEQAARVAAAAAAPPAPAATRGRNAQRPVAAPAPARQTTPAAPPRPADATMTASANGMTASANGVTASANGVTASANGTGPWRAHLASHRTEEAAINDWQARLKSNPQVYGALEPSLAWVDLPNRGSFARLSFGDFASKAEADAACARITGPGRYCNAVAE